MSYDEQLTPVNLCLCEYTSCFYTYPPQIHSNLISQADKGEGKVLSIFDNQNISFIAKNGYVTAPGPVVRGMNQPHISEAIQDIPA